MDPPIHKSNIVRLVNLRLLFIKQKVKNVNNDFSEYKIYFYISGTKFHYLSCKSEV